MATAIEAIRTRLAEESQDVPLARERRVRVREAHEGERLNVLGSKVIVKSDGDPRHMTFCDHPVPIGYGVPPHVHEDEDEMAYVLAGTIEFTTFAPGSGTSGAARTVRLDAGGFVHLPRGIPHSFRNVDDGVSRMLVITSPGARLHRMFRDLDAATMAVRNPHYVDVPTITARHGVCLI
jgi:mannose-6-phosphate isomerase-like protein (cupin superfamily)